MGSQGSLREVREVSNHKPTASPRMDSSMVKQVVATRLIKACIVRQNKDQVIPTKDHLRLQHMDNLTSMVVQSLALFRCRPEIHAALSPTVMMRVGATAVLRPLHLPSTRAAVVSRDRSIVEVEHAVAATTPKYSVFRLANTAGQSAAITDQSHRQSFARGLP